MTWKLKYGSLEDDAAAWCVWRYVRDGSILSLSILGMNHSGNDIEYELWTRAIRSSDWQKKIEAKNEEHSVLESRLHGCYPDLQLPEDFEERYDTIVGRLKIRDTR